jgi:hypothetical protein
MGLDSVELILRTEEEFSIVISDDEAAEVRTVGDFYKLVLSKLEVTPGCLSSKAFYQTRRALVECLGISRRSIRPATELSPLLPEETRLKQWQKIRQQLGLSIPGLRIPDWKKQSLYMRSLFLAAVFSLVLGGLALYRNWPAWLVAILATLLCIPLMMGICNVLIRFNPAFASELPADTAGELARVVLSLNYEHFTTAGSTLKTSDEDVWNKIVDIFCDQLQVRRDEVVPNARIVGDLGVG